MTTILVTGPRLDAAAVTLAEERGATLAFMPPYADEASLIAAARETGACAILSRMGRVSAAVIAAAPALRVIAKHGAGVDNIDLAAAAERGIPVLSVPGGNAVSVAEHTMASVLAVTKQLAVLDAGMRAGRWDKPGFLGREVAGLRMGLVGIGAIARATARMAQGFGLQLSAYDPHAPDAVFTEAGVERIADLDTLLARSDILSLHCPLTAETRNLLDARRLALLPQGAVVVNTARGGLIDEPALLEAVRGGHLSGAALDSFAVEPPSADHPFFGEPRILLSPHVAGVTAEAGARVARAAVQGALDIIEGRPVPPERIANRHLLRENAPAAEGV
ncbi:MULTISPECIES: NAD(P)-dependent oxidoreductase [Paracoccus]|uniref:NAD(P)-dependent oxidoreductase n=1 Tax=Paracoccus TaxID=265 RepID=UPI00086DC097|nr:MULTISPECIES: NAD(P)-dependent oxidoreductase [Paracoccus]ODT57703.1 MAG: hydroxyacid dehydrogenase [Paracoccus sp. SCN 68-21]